MTSFRNYAKSQNVEAVVDTNGSVIGVNAVLDLAHRGEMYGFYTSQTGVVVDESLDVLLTIGAKDMYVVFVARSNDAQSLPKLYEGTTVSANGTELLVTNFNRNFPDAALTKAYQGPTVTDPGTLFVSRRILSGGRGAFRISSEIRDGIERILKANTNYLVRVTASGTTDIIVEGVFYEA